MAKRRWGLASEAVSTIYKQIFIPIVTYACGSWGHDIHKVHIYNKLIAAQRRALIQITKAYRTSPNASIQVLARTPPITNVVEYYTKLWYIRWGRNININDQIVYAADFERPVLFSRSSHPAMINNIQFDSNDNMDIEIFTDGSKSEALVGCSFVAFREGTEIEHQQFRLGESCSSFQAELYAIRMAAYWCRDHFSQQKINIITDCASAIASLKTRSFHPLVNEIQNIMNSSTCQYFINWIRSHQGHFGNERADNLARLASTNTDLPIAYKNISIQTIKSRLWMEVIDKWQLKWEDNNSITNHFIPDIPKFLAIKWYYPNHNLTQMLTNHGRFFTYQSRFWAPPLPCALFASAWMEANTTFYNAPCLSLRDLCLKL
ncbi:uncharacterized protein [Centruroides vittatus]|uniref:uncharacterized protein n=1 Tax=Centruroides vittatus TaxID=120091 RepID=UPI00350F89CD